MSQTQAVSQAANLGDSDAPLVARRSHKNHASLTIVFDTMEEGLSL